MVNMEKKYKQKIVTLQYRYILKTEIVLLKTYK